LHDMSGNVWEWVLDRCGASRVIRGGGWNFSEAQIRSAYRTYFDSIQYSYPSHSGFRLVRSQPSPTPQQTPTPVVLLAPIQPAIETLPPGFVRINGGTFMMGSPENEPGRRENEGPQRQVTVSSFSIGRYPVTQKEYQEVMGANPSMLKRDNLPVENVSWFDAIEYCNRRSQREKLTPAYTIRGSGDNRTVTLKRRANGYRLPTEAEWEYACRAGTTTPFNTGDNIIVHPHNEGVVGSLAPNAWGLYDMHRNVLEWCWDWYGDYPSSAQTNPMGASSGNYRVQRGGSRGQPVAVGRSAYRSYREPTDHYYTIGFRLVRP